MATSSVSGSASRTATRPTPLPNGHRSLRRHVLCCAAGALLAASFAASAAAATTAPIGDPTERTWYSTFLARFNARVAPSLRVDDELAARVSQAWRAMVTRARGGEGRNETPLDQYPLLSFVDDRFLVMKIKDARGKESFVVRAEGASVPTLSTTLAGYLDEVVYPSLRAIAEEERSKLLEQPEYQPRLDQLAAQNPYLHGLPIRVPEMGPFKNRTVAFTGIPSRITAAESASYDEAKWRAGARKVVELVRNYQWGVAVEAVDLVEGDAVVCRYRFVREVAAVKDSFVGEGRRGVLLRQPRLGSVLEVSGCTSGCDEPTGWSLIFPEEARRRPALPRELRPPLGHGPQPDSLRPGPSTSSPFEPPS
jgi:hypothetical protein